MIKVFISHPFASNPELYKEKVNKICQSIIYNHDDILPISPLHLWSFMHTDKGYREEILDYCKYMIDGCNEVFMYVYNNRITEGQKIELDYALKKRKNIRFIEKEK